MIEIEVNIHIHFHHFKFTISSIFKTLWNVTTPIVIFFQGWTRVFFKSIHWICYNAASVLWGMWDFSSPTRDGTCTTPCIGRQSLRHSITREVPVFLFEPKWWAPFWSLLCGMRVKYFHGPPPSEACSELGWRGY